MRSLFPSGVLGCRLHSRYLEDKRIRPSNRPCGHYNQYANRSSTLLVQKCELIGSAFQSSTNGKKGRKEFWSGSAERSGNDFLPGIGLSRMAKGSVFLQL